MQSQYIQKNKILTPINHDCWQLSFSIKDKDLEPEGLIYALALTLIISMVLDKSIVSYLWDKMWFPYL